MRKNVYGVLAVIVLCSIARAEIAVKKALRIKSGKDAVHRLGVYDRMFLIEDQWEFK